MKSLSTFISLERSLKNIHSVTHRFWDIAVPRLVLGPTEKPKKRSAFVGTAWKVIPLQA